jgi:ADP-ribose pyrophosphatase YjhB (NUDIX family)
MLQLPTAGGHSRTPVAAPPGSSSAGRRPRSVYPRLDPAVIVAVGCGDWLLLGRKASWEAGRYSCLAGFAEVAETLEQAVEREVWEEAGVGVDLSTARYHSSQPWPFPQSIMIGFTVEAAAPKATVVPLAAETPAGAAAAAGAAAGAARAPTPQPQQQQLPAKRGLALLSGPAAMAAREVGLLPAEAERYLLPRLPAVQVCSGWCTGTVKGACRARPLPVGDSRFAGAARPETAPHTTAATTHTLALNCGLTAAWRGAGGPEGVGGRSLVPRTLAGGGSARPHPA